MQKANQLSTLGCSRFAGLMSDMNVLSTSTRPASELGRERSDGRSRMQDGWQHPTVIANCLVAHIRIERKRSPCVSTDRPDCPGQGKRSAAGSRSGPGVQALSSRLPFGLNFERHRPEAVELPQRPVRKGDKVRVLPPRGSTTKGDQRLWQVKASTRRATAGWPTWNCWMRHRAGDATVALDDLVVVAEFRDPIYPGLVSTGKVAARRRQAVPHASSTARTTTR